MLFRFSCRQTLSPIDLKVDLPDAFDLTGQRFIASGAGRSQFRISLPRRVTPICRQGNLQLLTDRLDLKAFPMLVDERRHDLTRRSSSAWAKNALASF